MYKKFLKTLKYPFIKEIYILIFLVPLTAILYKIYIPRANEFGCFDDCMNFGAGYFMLHGKTLFSQIYFNHNPLMAYISYFMQLVKHPQNIFELLILSRQILIALGFIFNFFIIRRFGIAGIGFVIFYEFSKFYIFGDRFLAEAWIVYPMVYLIGLLFYKFIGKKIFDLEYIIAGVFTWFVLFMREPYVISAILLYIFLLWKPASLSKKISIGLTFVLSIISFITIPLNDFFFDVFLTSYRGTGAIELHNGFLGIGLIKNLFYPLFILLPLRLNEFHILLLGLSIVFIISIFYLVKMQRNKKLGKALIFIYIVLFFANLRVVDPGYIYFAAFHMLPWFGMFILITFLLIHLIINNRKLIYTFYGILIITFGIYCLLPKTFFRQHVDTQVKFITNYGTDYKYGNVVNLLSQKNNTLFVDGEYGFDLMYFQSQRLSPYKYSWYAYFEVGYKRFEDAKNIMYKTNPPDFYYGNTMPKTIKKQYQVLYSDKRPTWLYVKKSIIPSISQHQWQAAAVYHVSLHKT